HGLVALLSEDVTFVVDAGEQRSPYGRARAITRPMHGAQAVARFLIAVQQQAPASIRPRLAQGTDQPGVLGYRDGVLLSALSLDIAEGQVRRIFVISDPQKLTRLGTLRFEH